MSERLPDFSTYEEYCALSPKEKQAIDDAFDALTPSELRKYAEEIQQAFDEICFGDYLLSEFKED